MEYEKVNVKINVLSFGKKDIKDVSLSLLEINKIFQIYIISNKIRFLKYIILFSCTFNTNIKFSK